MAAKLALELQIPVLDVRGAQIALESERRSGQGRRGRSRKWITQGREKIEVEIEVWRIEVEAFTRGQGRLVKVDTVAGVEDRAVAAWLRG